MPGNLKSKVYEVLAKYDLSREDVAFMTDVVIENDGKDGEKFHPCNEMLLTRRDKADIIDRIESVKTELRSFLRVIYSVGIIQILATIVFFLLIVIIIHK